MASFLSSNGISSYFDNILPKLSIYAYFMMLSHSMWSKYKNSKNSFNDVITNELYSGNDDSGCKSNDSSYSEGIAVVLISHIDYNG